MQNKLASLQTAIETGSLRQVQNLINRKGLVIARDNQGLTILHKAVLHGQKDIVQYLIDICPKAIFAKDHVSKVNLNLFLKNWNFPNATEMFVNKNTCSFVCKN